MSRRPEPSHRSMGKVLTHMCMSLDGFVAQPDDNPAELFDWYWGGDVEVPSAQEGMSFSVDAASAPMLRELTSGCGALIAGRRLFDQTDGWHDFHRQPRGGDRDREGDRRWQVRHDCQR